MVTDDGTAILTYADGTQNTIAGSDLVVARLAVANIAAEEVALVPTAKVTKAQVPSNDKANLQAAELPQTGEDNSNQNLSVIGMALMAILGLFGLGKKRKDN